MNALHQEWSELQGQYDSYEKYSLLIKLVNVTLVVVLMAMASKACFAVLVSAVLWLQDAIWKTFQARIEQRLLVVESAIKDGQTEQAMQYNSAWLGNRPGAIGLVAEYLLNALRPTVAFPHIVLLALSIYLFIA